MERHHQTEKEEIEKNLFDLIPDEIFIHVISYLDLTDPSNSGLFRVDRRFDHLCKSPCKELLLKKATMSKSMDLLSHCPRLERLRFEDGMMDTDLLAVHAIKHCPDLTSLKGVVCNNNNDKAKTTNNILEAVEGSPLRELELENPDFSSSLKMSHAMSGLKVITLIDCHHLDNDMLMAMGDSCKELSSFSFFSRLNNNDNDDNKSNNNNNNNNDGDEKSKWSDEALCHFLHGVKDTIEDLRLEAVNLMGSRSFFQALGTHCRVLRHLDVGLGEVPRHVWYNPPRVDRCGLMSILSLPRLERLDIPGHRLTGRDFVEVFGRRGGKEEDVGRFRRGLFAM